MKEEVTFAEDTGNKKEHFDLTVGSYNYSFKKLLEISRSMDSIFQLRCSPSASADDICKTLQW